MEQKSVEGILVKLLKEAISKTRNKRNEISKKRAGFWGYGLGYFITDLLKDKKDSNFRGKWIDDVEWKSLIFNHPNKVKGFGELWWGPKKDYSTLYSEKFYCEITFEKDVFSSYLFRFKIADKDYELSK